MTSLPLASPAHPTMTSIPLKTAGAAAILVALADWLFYRHAPGISIAVFAAVLSATALSTNPIRARSLQLLGASILLVAALLPAIEAFGILSLSFAAIGSAIFVLMATGWSARPPAQRVFDVGTTIFFGPLRLVADVGASAREAWDGDSAQRGGEWLAAWIVPFGLGAVFLFLFAQANPLIERWFAFDGSAWKDFDLVRPWFWLAVVAMTWSFLRVRLSKAPNPMEFFSALALVEDPSPGLVMPAQASLLLSDAAIIRSLILFNALFAVQSVLDAAYLWGHVALPAGMSYAAYAHRGAYPLIVTALLAGAFVLAAMRPGMQIERSLVVRGLVFTFIGQNILLVFSSMLRLDLYVQVYSLTGWRCAAFVWMLLVAAGLALIVARIAFGRSNAWLVWSNAAVLLLTLYACSFADFSGEIASFNVAHSREVAGIGEPIDLPYLCDLGPAALPALDTLTAKGKPDWQQTSSWLFDCRQRLKSAAQMPDWRGWSFRGHRLMRYLSDHGTSTAPIGP